MASKVILSAIAIALVCTLLSTAAADEKPPPHSLVKRFFGHHRTKVYVVNSHPIAPAYHPVYSSNPGYPSYSPPPQVVVIKKHRHHHRLFHRPSVNVHLTGR